MSDNSGSLGVPSEINWGKNERSLWLADKLTGDYGNEAAQLLRWYAFNYVPVAQTGERSQQGQQAEVAPSSAPRVAEVADATSAGDSFLLQCSGPSGCKLNGNGHTWCIDNSKCLLDASGLSAVSEIATTDGQMAQRLLEIADSNSDLYENEKLWLREAAAVLNAAPQAHRDSGVGQNPGGQADLPSASPAVAAPVPGDRTCSVPYACWWPNCECTKKASAPSATATTAWKPTKEQPLFSEYALRDEIARIWGGHGAHALVYRELLKDLDRYRWLRSLFVENGNCWTITKMIYGAPSCETLEQAMDAERDAS